MTAPSVLTEPQALAVDAKKPATLSPDGGNGKRSADDVGRLMAHELLLTVEETARVLRVTPDSVRNLTRCSQLAACKVGKHLRWRPCDVKAYVEGLGAGKG